jgi:glucan phosphorylase
MNGCFPDLHLQREGGTRVLAGKADHQTDPQCRRDHQPGSLDAKAILNVARMGKAASDRTILAYARDIWGIL